MNKYLNKYILFASLLVGAMMALFYPINRIEATLVCSTASCEDGTCSSFTFDCNAPVAECGAVCKSLGYLKCGEEICGEAISCDYFCVEAYDCVDSDCVMVPGGPYQSSDCNNECSGGPPPPGTPDFSVDIVELSKTIEPGQPTSFNPINITPVNSYSGTVNLSVSGCPPSATCTFSATADCTGGTTASCAFTNDSPNPGISRLDITNTAGVAHGTYPLTVTGNDGTLSRSDTAVLIVTLNTKGWFDKADCTAFYGWTCDPDDYAQPLQVEFYKDGPIGGGGVLIGTAVANQPREAAVGSACGGYSDHGFVYPTPNSVKDNTNHPIYAYAVDIPSGAKKQLIPGWNIICQPPPANQAPVAVATISKDGTTYADSITVTQGVATPIYLSASGSSDPDGWTDAEKGVSSGGKCEWNYDLEQGPSPTYEVTVSNPSTVQNCSNFAANGSSKTFNDAPGTYTYNVLRITDKPGAVSNVDTVQVTVQPPVITAISVTPSSGTGLSQTFSQLYQDTAGANDITQVWTFLRTTFPAAAADNACYTRWDKATNSLFLLNDAGTVWSAGITIGTAGTLENSQCILNVGPSSVSFSGNDLTLNLALTFKSSFAGTKEHWLYANNGSGQNSGWQKLGTWTIPSAGACTTPGPGTNQMIGCVWNWGGAGGSSNFNDPDNVEAGNAPVQSVISTPVDSATIVSFPEGSTAAGLTNYFLVRWQSNFQFSGGNYQFIVSGQFVNPINNGPDDGFRVFVDSNQISPESEWVAQCCEGDHTYTVNNLSAGNHLVKLEFLEIAGTQAISLRWYKIPPPPAPSNLQADNTSCGQIKLTWTDNSTNETGFHIWRDVSPGGTPPTVSYNGKTYYRIATTPANSTSYTDNPSPGASYYYIVTSYNADGDSTISSGNAVGPVYNNPCQANLSGSSKAVYQVNGVNYTGQMIKNGDIVTFKIVINNSPPLANWPAFDVYIEDTLSDNLVYQLGTAKINYGAGFVSIGSENVQGQTITWNWPAKNLGDKAADMTNWLITFDAKVQSTLTQAVDFFQNTAQIYYALSNGGPQNQSVIVTTGLIPFRTGATRVPQIWEIAP